MKIGILGGTFNPIHLGHLVLAKKSISILKLDKIIFIPAYISPHKKETIDILSEHRLNMLKIALKEEKSFEKDTYEIDQKKISYTINTIKYLKNKYKTLNPEFFFLTGADQHKKLHTWKNIDQILSLVTFVIATRPKYKIKESKYKNIKQIIIPEINISSSLIREKIRENKDISKLTPSKIINYIKENKIYK